MKAHARTDLISMTRRTTAVSAAAAAFLAICPSCACGNSAPKESAASCERNPRQSQAAATVVVAFRRTARRQTGGFDGADSFRSRSQARRHRPTPARFRWHPQSPGYTLQLSRVSAAPYEDPRTFTAPRPSASLAMRNIVVKIPGDFERHHRAASRTTTPSKKKA